MTVARSPRVVAVALLAAGSIGLWAPHAGAAGSRGAGVTNGEERKRAVVVLADARRAMTRVTTVRVVGHLVSQRGLTSIDMVLVRGVGGGGRLTRGASQVDVVRIGTAVYVRGNAAWLGSAAPQALAGRWLRTTTASPMGQAELKVTDFNGFTMLSVEALASTVGRSRLDGRPVVVLSDEADGSTLDVSDVGPALPLRIRGAGNDLRYTDYGARVALRPPTSYVDLQP